MAPNCLHGHFVEHQIGIFWNQLTSILYQVKTTEANDVQTTCLLNANKWQMERTEIFGEKQYYQQVPLKHDYGLTILYKLIQISKKIYKIKIYKSHLHI